MVLVLQSLLPVSQRQELNTDYCTCKLLRRQPSPCRAAAYTSSRKVAAAADACSKGPSLGPICSCVLVCGHHLESHAAALPLLQHSIPRPIPPNTFLVFLQALETRTVAAAAVVSTVDILDADTEWGHLDALLEEAAHCEDIEESTSLRVQQVTAAVQDMTELLCSLQALRWLRLCMVKLQRCMACHWSWRPGGLIHRPTSSGSFPAAASDGT